MLNYMSTTQNNFWALPDPKIDHYGPKSQKKAPKLSRIEWSIENESCSTKLVDSKTLFELKQTPKTLPSNLWFKIQIQASYPNFKFSFKFIHTSTSNFNSLSYTHQVPHLSFWDISNQLISLSIFLPNCLMYF